MNKILAIKVVVAASLVGVWVQESFLSMALADEKSPATETKTEEKEKVELDKDKREQEQTKRENRAKVLAERFKVSESSVLELRQKKMGWGEISHLLAIAQKSGESIQTILALRESGMGWGKIAQKYNLKLGEINREVHATKHLFKESEHSPKEHSEKIEKGEKVSREHSRPEKPARAERAERAGHKK